MQGVTLICYNSFFWYSNSFYLGWGRTEGGGNVAEILQQGVLPVQSHENCSKVNDDLGPIDETSMICGGSGKANQTGGCQGDSGGPYVCAEYGKWVLRGAVSWGHGLCKTEYFSVFARISSFRDWIDAKIEGKGMSLPIKKTHYVWYINSDKIMISLTRCRLWKLLQRLLIEF